MSGDPKASVIDYMRNETRFRMVEKMNPKRFEALQQQALRSTMQRFAVYKQLAGITVPRPETEETAEPVETK